MTFFPNQLTATICLKAEVAVERFRYQKTAINNIVAIQRFVNLMPQTTNSNWCRGELAPNFVKFVLASIYSPGALRLKYHRRWRA